MANDTSASPSSSSPTPSTPRTTPSPPSKSTTTTTKYTYPFAPSPDIIRASQKDAYFTGQLLSQLADLTRSIYGARFAQTHTTQLRVVSDLLYLGLTTGVGNRTLGEEYCDVVSVEVDGGKDLMGRLPTWQRRVGYVGVSVLGGWLVGLWLPASRRYLKQKLENIIARRKEKERIAAQAQTHGKRKPSTSTSTTKQPTSTLFTRLLSYILSNLNAITSPSPFHALSLTAFYFTSKYYTLPRRLFRLRYTLTRSLSPGEASQRAGYEVLGLLLMCQLAVQGYLHIRETVASSNGTSANPPVVANAGEMMGTTAQAGGGVEVGVGGLSLDANAFAPNTGLLFESEGVEREMTTELQEKIAKVTGTPIAHAPRIDLADTIASSATTRTREKHGDDLEKSAQEQHLGWLKSEQSRKCTLCLEPMRDPAATTCGHLFCWACIEGWVKERAECPLCRQECRAQHVLVLRG